MDASIPPYLFRASSSQTVGTNGPNQFAPQKPSTSLLSKSFGLQHDGFHGGLSNQLYQAIVGHKTAANPFVFFTSSLLCAYLHACKKRKIKKETDVNIVCIPTASLKNDAGHTATFRPLAAARKDLKMKKLGAQWTGIPLDYADVFVTTDTVVLPKNSRRVFLDDLESAGLFQVVPELGIISKRGNPGLATPMADLRELWYEEQKCGAAGNGQDLHPGRFTIAARLAMAFEPISTTTDTEEEVPSHLVAWFLALRFQDPEGSNLNRWLGANAVMESRAVETGPPCLARERAEEVLELKEWIRLYEKLRPWTVQALQIHDALPTNTLAAWHVDTIAEDAQSYLEFKKRKRESAEEKRKEQESRKRARLCEEGPEESSGEEGAKESSGEGSSNDEGSKA